MSDLIWILLQKSFWGDERNFSGPLMRFARGDMRDHIVSHKNDHGASYWRYGILRWRSWLKINICEIFGVVRFSTFATISFDKPTSASRRRPNARPIALGDSPRQRSHTMGGYSPSRQPLVSEWSQLTNPHVVKTPPMSLPWARGFLLVIFGWRRPDWNRNHLEWRVVTARSN